MTIRENGILAMETANTYVHAHTKREAQQKALRMVDDHPVIKEIARRLPDEALTYANWPILERLCRRNKWPAR